MTKAKAQAEQPTDLGAIDPTEACSKGFEFELTHWSSEKPLGVFITVLGSESREYKDYVRERRNEEIERSQRPGKKRKAITVEDSEREGAALLAAVTTGWRTGDTKALIFNGDEVPFTVGAARKIYIERDWIRFQVDRAVHDLGNFNARP